MDTSFLTTIAPLVLVFAIFYFMVIRPQQQRAKEHRAAIENVRRGDTVVTAGGIIGRVAKVREDGEIMVEIADNVQVRVMKSTLSEIRSKTAAADAKAEKS
jgi:preprotein translocase subunit YajC